MKLEIRLMSSEEIKELNACGMPGDDLAQKKLAVVFTDESGHSGKLFIETEIVERLGAKYIATHSKLEYSKVCDEWFPKLSQNDYYNDPERNPPKTIEVRFIEEKCGEQTEVWQNVETDDYYLRMLCNEPFARWMTCGNRMTGWQDRNNIRPNITFKHGTKRKRSDTTIGTERLPTPTPSTQISGEPQSAKMRITEIILVNTKFIIDLGGRCCIVKLR